MIGMSEEDRFWFGKVKYRILEGKRGVKEAYDCMASVYDHSEYLYWTRKMEEAEERIAKKWVEAFSGICLDVGCGTGRYSLKVAKKCVGTVALDLSLKMLKRLKLKAKEDEAYEQLSVVLADGERLPFRDNVFDGLVCALAFDHFLDNEEAAREFSRVLKFEGLCLISAFNSRMLESFQTRYGFQDKVPFRTENMSPVLVFEIGHSAWEIEKIFRKYGLQVENIRGCCYWHLNPLLETYYPPCLDNLFNLFKDTLKYAEIHTVLMKRKRRKNISRGNLDE